MSVALFFVLRIMIAPDAAGLLDGDQCASMRTSGAALPQFPDAGIDSCRGWVSQATFSTHRHGIPRAARGPPRPTTCSAAGPPPRGDDAGVAGTRHSLHPPRFDAVTRSRSEHAREFIVAGGPPCIENGLAPGTPLTTVEHQAVPVDIESRRRAESLAPRCSRLTDGAQGFQPAGSYDLRHRQPRMRAHSGVRGGHPLEPDPMQPRARHPCTAGSRNRPFGWLGRSVEMRRASGWRCQSRR